MQMLVKNLCLNVSLQEGDEVEKVFNNEGNVQLPDGILPNEMS